MTSQTQSKASKGQGNASKKYIPIVIVWTKKLNSTSVTLKMSLIITSYSQGKHLDD